MGRSSHPVGRFRLNRVVRTFLLTLVFLPIAALADFDHGDWDNLLREHVKERGGGVATQVDYGGMASDRSKIRTYLSKLSAVSRSDFDAWSEPAQLAFLINAYNAWTVDLILDDYPDIDSIRDIGFLLSSAWNQDVANLFGESVTLDEIEHEMIRGWGIYNEPRIHFAVNCAAIGCPALRGEAYTQERLEMQLDDSTKKFLSDRSRNYLDNGRIYISRIFDWYEEDFEQGWGGVNSVGEFLANYSAELALDTQTAQELRVGDIRIRYLRYDWGLNDIR